MVGERPAFVRALAARLSRQETLPAEAAGTEAAGDARKRAAVVLALRGEALDAEALFIVRATDERDPWSGHVALPGGREEPGDADLLETALRELREETGLEVGVGPLLEVVELIGHRRHYVVVDYRCAVTGGSLRPGDDAVEARFVRAAELDHYGVTEAVTRVVAKALER